MRPPPEDAAGELRYRSRRPCPTTGSRSSRSASTQGAQIRLRRAAALLDSANGEPGFSRPLGRLLEPENEDLSLFEEEVPRGGARVIRRFQYARWIDGSHACGSPGARAPARRGLERPALRRDRRERLPSVRE